MNRPVRHKPLALQDAKARFSAVVDAAMRGEAQHVTKRGKPAVVIVSAEEFERLRGHASPRPSFIEHLLAMPKAPRGEPALRFPRLKLRLRDVDLSS